MASLPISSSLKNSLLVALLLTELSQSSEVERYIKKLEEQNSISYTQIENSRGLYITPMCYTKTQESNTSRTYNPCYVCHTKGVEPNYIDDRGLQLAYSFPKPLLKNPYTNLFKDKTKEIEQITKSEILTYIRRSNYFDSSRTIIFQKRLPSDWRGYKPDCYYHFDNEGFDRDRDGAYTGWRAFRYTPFAGTFLPTNGSTDDVLIRLDRVFMLDKKGRFDLEIYKLNLAIIEALIKQKDITLEQSVDEKLYGVDLNQNGTLDSTSKIAIASYDKLSYIGQAKELLSQGKLHIALGLYPVGTEFLHSVRYLDWDEQKEHSKLSARMKELRYAKKYAWQSYSQLKRTAYSELQEMLTTQNNQAQMEVWMGDYERGLDTNTGWRYQGFIESKDGDLRPQTKEETIYCMGCHAGLGVTSDSTFAFARKIENGWNHWSQKSLIGIEEPKVSYQNHPNTYEYSFYLANNPTGNEYRDNDEVQKKFFDNNGTMRAEAFEKLHSDISTLLYPSKERALRLNKAYKVIVNEQSFIYGRDATVKPLQSLHKTIKNISTHIGLRGMVGI